MSEFDRGIVTEVEGEVVALSWRNPHVLFDIAVTDDDGQEVVWHLEGGALSSQRRRGLTPERIQVGDHVRAAGWPSTRRSGYLQVNHILAPDGTELLVGRIREPRWSDTHLGSGEWAVDPAIAATATAEGLFRVWSQRLGGAFYFLDTDAYRLTDSALAIVAEWDEFEDDPVLACTPPGMPAMMTNPYPMEFVQRADGDIVMRFEEFDSVRTVHMTDIVDPAEIAASPMGYSIGRWEGETLIVSTSRINWPYLNRVGVPQSEAVEVLERFTLVENENRLDYELMVTDPATLIEPFVWEGYWDWRPGEAVQSYDCSVEG